MKKVFLVCTLLLFSLFLLSCNKEKERKDTIKLSDIKEGDLVIDLKEYKEKITASYIAQMIGVSWAYPVEFHSHNAMSESRIPRYTDTTILEAYNQDDIYLSVTAVEVLDKLGLDVSPGEIGIYMYNKDFEFWNGSNNDVLIRGYKPPMAGYPNGHGYLTQKYPDGNSYLCGISFAGLLAPGNVKASNELSRRFAGLTNYGDGIYGPQMLAAMYGASFYETDIRKLIEIGLDVIPEQSWIRLAVEDTLNWFDSGMSFEDLHALFMQKYWYDETYNWIDWPYGGRTSGINLDCKSCLSFMIMGWLYGDGDFEESIKYTIRAANDTDSNAAHVAGVMALWSGLTNVDQRFVKNLSYDLKFKYSNLNLTTLVDAAIKLAKEINLKYGGINGIYNGKEVMVIKKDSKTVTPDKYQNSLTPDPADIQMYKEQEMDRMRAVADPGFERHNSRTLTNNWKTNDNTNVFVEFYSAGKAYEGLANVYMKSKAGTVTLSKNVDTTKNTVYEASFYIGGLVNSATVKIKIQDMENNVIREIEITPTSEYEQYFISFNSMSFNTVEVVLEITSNNANNYIRVDNFTFFKK